MTHNDHSKPVQTEKPDPEVLEKLARRMFTAKYKLRILDEADKLSDSGEIGKFLRSEGLYSSHITTWKRQREQGLLQGLSPKKRGRKKKEVNPLSQEVARLERENKQLQERLRKAETIIKAQKKISELMGLIQEET